MNSTETANFDLPLPSRNFAATRRVLLVVLVASILIPLVCLVAYAYYDFERRVAAADEMVERVTRVADEHALKVMDLNQQLETRIVDLLADNDDANIRSREDTLHRTLDEIGGGYPQVAAISLFGVDGDLLASSRYFPSPHVSIAERDDFRSARAIAPITYFSQPLRGRVGQSDVFTTTMGRLSLGGRFLGVVSIALKRDYFSNFYRELTGGDPALTIGLYRRDGGVLVRYPGAPADTQAAAGNTPFTNAFRNNELYGRMRMTSTIDNVEKLLAFRRVGDYPLYVASGYAMPSIFQQWWHHCLLIAAFALVPCVVVWLLVAFSIRRLNAEEAAWERWQAEVAMRLSIEASSRQLRRMGALGNLVANVAHDFNNLLMVVASNMELARRKNFNDVESEVLAVERATAGAESLARRLMSVARKQPLKQELINPGAWLTGITELVRSSVRSHVVVSVELSPDLWFVMADPVELELAIVNIAVNASDAMPRGGRLVIRCQNVRVSAGESELPNGEYVLISISDNGEGMSDAVRQRAFEPLFTTKPKGMGTGLGLPQVFAFCERAGGLATIDSAIGAGTSVRLYLPRAGAADLPGAAVASEPAAPCESQGLRVLLVEDNEEVAAGTEALLTMMGHRVTYVFNADAAITVLEAARDALPAHGAGFPFDVVLSDIHMPGRLNGIDLAEVLQTFEPHVPVILVTGYAEELDRARHVDARVLSKPFDIALLDTLLQAIRKDAKAVTAADSSRDATRPAGRETGSPA